MTAIMIEVLLDVKTDGIFFLNIDASMPKNDTFLVYR